MPFGFNRVQSYGDILNVLAKAQAENKEVTVSTNGSVKVEGWWSRRSRVWQERAQGQDWANNQKLARNAAVANSLKNALARGGVDVDGLPQDHRLRLLLNAVPTKPNLPGVKLFSNGVKQVFPEFTLRDPHLDKLRPEDIQLPPDVQHAPLPAARSLGDRGVDHDVMVFPQEALANPDAPDVPLPPNLKKVHDNVERLVHKHTQRPIRWAEIGKQNLFQFETGDVGLGQNLSRALDPSKNYLYAIIPDQQGKLHLRLGFEHNPTRSSDTRQGHPTLMQDLDSEAKALIAGELRFNPAKNGWEIDDFSGRYGSFPQGVLAAVGVSKEDVMQYAAFRFESAGFRLANLNFHRG